MNKAYLPLTSDVESGLTTISNTLKLLDAMPSISKEGGEMKDNEKENFDRKDVKLKFEKLLKVQCVQCNENTYMLKKTLWQLKSMILLKLQKMITWMNELYESKCESDNVNKCIIYISI